MIATPGSTYPSPVGERSDRRARRGVASVRPAFAAPPVDARRVRFRAAGFAGTATSSGSGCGRAQTGVSSVASKRTWRMIEAGSRTGGPTGAASGSAERAAIGGSALALRSDEVERRVRNGNRPRPRGMARAYGVTSALSLATVAQVAGTFVTGSANVLSRRSACRAGRRRGTPRSSGLVPSSSEISCALGVGPLDHASR